ncbi:MULTISPECIES: Flp pilus assembly protein CpaB [Bacillus cereus group]|uniref:Flp pilus assembly protein CpaB n=2 Tax=Bacillus cereus group TaxID=86661 RepID=A0A9W5RC66_BACCE|nr:MULTISPECIES: RcpC/CpaB family pilus assembly protein [Bacillus cereus group]EOQ19786.1 flp pilus assembly protein CpaB [Bacillus cereus VD184]OUB76882.1 pilus assembly protein CpaB [Bacillus thuringiensis serovar jegathesan]
MNFNNKKLIAGTIALGAVASVWGYTYMQTESKVKPVKAIVTKQDIAPHTKITEDMILEKEFPMSGIPPKSALKKEDVVGKWTKDGYGIAKNSYMNVSKIAKQEELPDAGVISLKPGEYAFPVLVDLETSNGNAIVPNTYVDLYFATNLEAEKLGKVVGIADLDKKFISESVKFFGLAAKKARVVSVKDSTTSDVFNAVPNTQAADGKQPSNTRKQARLYTIAVDKDALQVLNKAKLNGKIIPITSGQSYEDLIKDKKVANLTDETTPASMSNEALTRNIIEMLTYNPQHFFKVDEKGNLQKK